MKKIVLLASAAMVLFGLNSYGQNPDTSKIRIGNKKYIVIVDDDKDIRILTEGDSNVVIRERRIEKEHKPVHRMNGTWAGFELGLTNFVNSDNTMTLPEGADFMDLKVANSMEFNFNFAEKTLGIIKNYVGIVTGLGFQYQNYRFVNDFSFTKTDNGIVAEPVEMELYKNRLAIWHLNLPLMVQFQIPVYGENRRIKLAAGVIGGLRIGSRQVQKYIVNGEKQKIKIKDDFYLRDFNYGFTARVGYGDVALFANYYPQTLFENCKGPEIYPVTIGIHFGG
ncbi:MAG: hypothetical protein D4R64_08860 [Porphyromonadaceae bacterium]|nr:MAG: hypothetical protein D4R64_08860 [Porphyromonadaceae bacterium]